MIAAAPPLRFLMLVVLSWVFVRGAMLARDWTLPEAAGDALAPPAFAAAPFAPPAEAGPPFSPSRLPPAQPVGFGAAGLSILQMTSPPVDQGSGKLLPARDFAETPFQAAPSDAGFAQSTAATGLFVPVASDQPEPLPVAGRWSGSAYVYLRSGGEAQLAPGGTLGASQAGARVLYRLNRDAARPLSASARLYVPLDDIGASEIAAGIDWRPSAKVPVNIVLERRQALGSRGRSDFAVTVYGGVGPKRIAGPVRMEAYAQAGAVGIEEADGFVDGAVRTLVPIDTADRFRVGAGIWGAAQPGVERLDVGPHLSARLAPGMRASAEWRFRIAGEARPSSGPTLTIGKDF